MIIIKFEKDGILNNEFKFTETHNYIPNIGDSVHNEKDIYNRYFVVSKDIFYNTDILITNIIILAKTTP